MCSTSCVDESTLCGHYALLLVTFIALDDAGDLTGLHELSWCLMARIFGVKNHQRTNVDGYGSCKDIHGDMGPCERSVTVGCSVH